MRKAAALSLSTVMLLGGMPAPALAQMANGIEVVAQAIVASGMWGTCKWELSDGGTLTVHPGQAPSQPKGADSPWIDYAGDITEVICTEENGKMVVLGESAENLFAEQYNVLEFDLAGLDSSNVRNFSGMFSGCTQVERLPYSQVENIDTSNATDMSRMYEKCSSLVSIHIPEINTKKVTNANSMFKGCSRLEEIDASNFNTAKITDMGEMFSGCSSLVELDINGFDTSNVTNMENMFTLCYSLEGLDVSGFDTSKVTNMYGMIDTYTIYSDTDHGIGIADAKVTLGESSYTWTGAEVKPTVTVELDGMTLRHGIDYDVSYQDNVQVGEAQLTVTGKGAFKGTKTVPFTIA